ncbi:MAG: hypothetical protein BJ554DRAFT_6602, partial [Olpidium bornovanus]
MGTKTSLWRKSSSPLRRYLRSVLQRDLETGWKTRPSARTSMRESCKRSEISWRPRGHARRGGHYVELLSTSCRTVSFGGSPKF